MAARQGASSATLAKVQAYRARLREHHRAHPTPQLKEKVCPRCQVPKAPDEFHRNHSAPDGLHWVCKTCNKGTRTYRQNTEQRRRYRVYDIAPQTVEALQDLQGNRCAICRKV